VRFVKAYLGTTVAFLIVDAIWISLFVGNHYQNTVGHLLLATPKFLPAGLFYLAYPAGIVLFAVQPALISQHMRTALINGAVLGAIAYGTFSLTNFSVLKGWTTGLVVSDISWGGFLTAVCACCGYLLARD
jgi:uncharacterized membrane protein